MAQVEKWNMAEALAIIAHVERTGETHSNDHINPDLTENNYALWPPNDPDQLVFDTGVPGQSSARYAYARLRKRLKEVSCLQRKDVNVLCTWCLHLGVDVPPGYASRRAFFEAAVGLMTKMYGAKNVVFAWVHEDEDGAHLHFGFVPVVRKELKLRSNASEAKKAEYAAAVAAGKTEIERVDANALINRKHLQSWHGFMSKRMQEILGYNPAIYTGVTQYLGGNMSVDNLKRMGPKWRAKRDAKVAAFHEQRRAAKEGRQAGLDAVITSTEQSKRQTEWEPKHRNDSLADLIGDAKNKGGSSRW